MTVKRPPCEKPTRRAECERTGIVVAAREVDASTSLEVGEAVDAVGLNAGHDGVTEEVLGEEGVKEDRVLYLPSIKWPPLSMAPLSSASSKNACVILLYVYSIQVEDISRRKILFLR